MLRCLGILAYSKGWVKCKAVNCILCMPRYISYYLTKTLSVKIMTQCSKRLFLYPLSIFFMDGDPEKFWLLTTAINRSFFGGTNSEPNSAMCRDRWAITAAWKQLMENKFSLKIVPKTKRLCMLKLTYHSWLTVKMHQCIFAKILTS